MPVIVYELVAGKMVSLIDLQTIYGTEDAYNLLEILHLKNHNKFFIQKQQERQK